MSGGEAAAGLVSFSNKVETNLADGEKHQRREWRMQRGVIGSARIIHNDFVEAGIPMRSALGTLTYRPDVAWEPRHITDLLQHYAKWAKRRGFRFQCVWRMEPHADGRPHYHFVFWMPKGITPPMPDKQGWWKHGMTNVKWARSPVGYIAKYAAKGAEDVYPKGARIWGAVGLTAGQRARAQWCVAPRWVRRLVSPSVGCRRVARLFANPFQAKWAERWNTHSPGLPMEPLPAVKRVLWRCMGTLFDFESPYEFGGFDSSGLVLNRREKPRCWTSDGDQFFYKVQPC
jgi:hypothetical protein